MDAWLISLVENGFRSPARFLLPQVEDCFWLVVARSTHPNQFSEKKLECTNHQSLSPFLIRPVVILVSWWRDYLTGPAVGEGEGARVDSSQNLELSPTG